MRRCDVSLTYHKYLKDLHCHYCGYRESEPRVCPRCGSEEVESKGIGTERIEEEIATHFPDVKRRDGPRHHPDPVGHERIIRAFETGRCRCSSARRW